MVRPRSQKLVLSQQHDDHANETPLGQALEEESIATACITSLMPGTVHGGGGTP
jgi:hypothetical protein